jgi:hypothetical protein
MFAGQVIVGSSLSVTVTSNEHVEVFPEASVATETTVVVPTGKTEPEAGVETTEDEQLSPVLTVKVTTAPQEPGSVLTDIFAGHAIVGSSLSVTVTSNEHVAVFPLASVAVDTTVVVPTGNTEPEAGTETTDEEQLSVEVTEKVTIAPQEPASVLTVMFAGQAIVGSSLSTTVTVKEQVAELPEPSRAV